MLASANETPQGSWLGLRTAPRLVRATSITWSSGRRPTTKIAAPAAGNSRALAPDFAPSASGTRRDHPNLPPDVIRAESPFTERATAVDTVLPDCAPPV